MTILLSRSVRPTFENIIVNVDTTIGVILPAGDLERICAEHLGLNNSRYLGAEHVPRLRLFLRNVKVEISKLPGHPNKRPQSIRDVVADVGNITFEKNGERISIGDHFSRAHRYPIRPKALGVKLGSGIFPMSVCVTQLQLYKNRASPEVVREALEFSPRDPRARLDAIKAGWQELQYTQSPFLIGAGIKVDSEPLAVSGRVLPSPRLLFGPDESLVPQRQGTWDMLKKHFTIPATLTAWTIVDFANAAPPVLDIFITDLMVCMRERGMIVEDPRGVSKRSPQADIPAVRFITSTGLVKFAANFLPVMQVLHEIRSKTKATMIMVILPESAPQPYRVVKRYGDVTGGICTQCVKWSRKLTGEVQQRRANQYYNNLLLKINTKLGGINYTPWDDHMAFLKQVPTLIIGADVSHPAPGSHLPSISGFVSSTDSRLCRYVASTKVQASRTEMIEEDVLQDQFGTA
ncbi:hypothetical protein H0H87_002137 [Tephrocybe sp. NHM501043]|nr:hypothetical protein H0H87_002137 [Tephrocybe sp. NHM501043]